MPFFEPCRSGLCCRSCSHCALCRSALLGMVPQCVQPPPTSKCRSISATLLWFLAAVIAAPPPAVPLPMTRTSTCSTREDPCVETEKALGDAAGECKPCTRVGSARAQVPRALCRLLRFSDSLLLPTPCSDSRLLQAGTDCGPGPVASTMRCASPSPDFLALPTSIPYSSARD